MTDIAIRLNQVSKYYKLYGNPKDRLKEALHPLGKKYHQKFFPIQDISLEIRRGEVVGIVGKNGSGKSTLLKIISGVLSPSSGSLDINGKVIALLELGAGFNPEFTGLENILFYARILGFSQSDIDKKLDQMIAFADIGEFIGQPLKNYSSGMKARLGFAVAAHLNPEILIVDEVLAVGDLLFQKKCYDRINELFRSGTTVILVSHSAQAIAQFCGRAILLHDKRIVMDGEPGAVIKQYQQLLFANKNAPIEQQDDDRIAVAKVAPDDSSPSASPKYKVNNEFFLEGLRFEPSAINAHVAEFMDVHLLDSKKEIVNLLERGRRYCLQYKLSYLKDCENVSFGAQIVSLNGLLISGANTRDYMACTVPVVSAQEDVLINWHFDCDLVTGTYHFNIFATTNDESDTVLMHSAVAFMVNSVAAKNGGVVNLKQEIEVFCAEPLKRLMSIDA